MTSGFLLASIVFFVLAALVAWTVIEPDSDFFNPTGLLAAGLACLAAGGTAGSPNVSGGTGSRSGSTCRGRGQVLNS